MWSHSLIRDHHSICSLFNYLIDIWNLSHLYLLILAFFVLIYSLLSKWIYDFIFRLLDTFLTVFMWMNRLDTFQGSLFGRFNFLHLWILLHFLINFFLTFSWFLRFDWNLRNWVICHFIFLNALFWNLGSTLRHSTFDGLLRFAFFSSWRLLSRLEVFTGNCLHSDCFNRALIVVCCTFVHRDILR